MLLFKHIESNDTDDDWIKFKGKDRLPAKSRSKLFELSKFKAFIPKKSGLEN